MSDEKHKEIVDAVTATKLDTLLGDVSELKDSVKELARTVNRLALIEERQSNTADSVGRAFKEIEKHDMRIKMLEQAQPIQKQSSDIVQHLGKLAISALAGAIIAMAVINPRQLGPQVVIPSPAQSK